METRPTKYIVINYVGRKGAGPIFAYEMARGFLDNGCDVTLITTPLIENLVFFKALSNLKILFTPSYTNSITFFFKTIFFRLFGIKKIKKYFSKRKVDLCYLPMDTPWGGIICKLFRGSKVITTLHDPVAHSTNFQGRFLARAQSVFLPSSIRFSTDLVILSSCFSSFVLDKYKFSANNIHIIPHGNFDYYFHCSDGSIHQYPAGKIHFLFFGRIDHYKGLPLLALAYEAMYKNHPDISLTIAGNGDFSSYQKNFDGLKNLDLNIGWIPDEKVASFFLPENVVVILPYIDATQSGVIPIAASGSRLVIASRTGGLIEQTDNGDSALLFETGNFEDLEKMMEIAFTNSSYCQQKIIRAKQKSDSLSWSILSKKIINII